VSVFPKPLWTRLSRWSRRHKRLVGGFAGLLIMAVLALGVSTAVVNAQKRAAQQARRDAELAKSQAEDHLRLGLEVVEALVTLGDKQLISPKESTATREQLLSRALIFIRRFRERRSEDPAIQAESAQVARRLANLYRLRGEFAQAEPSYDEAITLIEDLRQRYPGRRSFDDLLAENLLDAGESLSMIGRAAAAEELFRRAHGIAEQLTAGSDRASMYRRTWGRSLYRLASVGLALGREDAPSHAREAVEQLRTLADASLPGVRDEVMGGQILPLTDQIELVIAQGIQAEGSHRAGLDSEAERQLREALGRMDRLVDQFRDIPIDDIAYFHATTSIELCRLLIERQAGTQDEPLPRLDDAIARLTNIVERSATIRHFRATLGQAYTVRARAHELSRRLDLSKADAGRAREILESLVARYPTIFDHLSELAEVHDTLGRVALARGDREAATREFEEALRLHQKAIEAAPANPLYRERLSKHQAAVVRRAG
jgi:tetratricopeptide (TPR) repeat protein